MFGLGWMELLIIGGVIMLFAGPVGARKLLQSVQQLQKTKNDLMGGTPLERLQKVDEMLAGKDAAEDESGANERAASEPSGAPP